MFILIILRLLFVFKWLLQLIGVALAISVVGWVSSEREMVALCSLGFLIIPEMVMGCVIWIGKGVSEVSSRSVSSEINDKSVSIFGKHLIIISIFSYGIVLIGISGAIGAIFKISVLSIGIAILLCLSMISQFKRILEEYLTINV